MKTFITCISVVILTACSHPLEISGEGDITASTESNSCSLEQQPCDNYVVGDYNVTYTAVPREGWIFAGWDGCGTQFPQCIVNVAGATVAQYWGQTMPSLRAVFTPDAGAATISATTSWSAVADTVTIDVSVSGMTPLTVRLFSRGGDDDWVLEDASEPFSFTLVASELDPGEHELLLVAADGTTTISENTLVEVTGCNGHHELCSRGYDQVRYVTTHNAMSNATDGWNGPNQNLDVPAQLEAGVRGLMLDTYRAGDISQFGQIQVPGVDPDTSYLCHSLCAIGKQPLAEGLGEIREFLDENPGAVVTLILESYLSHTLTAAAFDAANLTHYAYQHAGGNWPTLGQMVDAGTRLVVLQDTAVNPAYPWLMNVWQHAFETHYSASAPEDFSCADNRGSPGSDLFIFNHFLTNTFGSPALAAQVNYNPLLMSRINECEAFQATPANFVTVDFVDIGDTLAAVKALNQVGVF